MGWFLTSLLRCTVFITPWKGEPSQRVGHAVVPGKSFRSRESSVTGVPSQCLGSSEVPGLVQGAAGTAARC